MPATDILGKIGEKVGSEFNSFRVSIGNTYATQAALNSLSASVTTNTGNISTNATDIATNASAIATNATDIATNASNISTNATDIATNASAISTNATNISTNATDISALQTKTGSLAVDGNSASFSGNLSAQNLTLAGDLTVNGTTTTLNTQTLEVEDNIIEVNLTATDGSETAQTGGIQINRGKVVEARGPMSAQNNSGSGAFIRYYELVATGQYGTATITQINTGQASNSVSFNAGTNTLTFDLDNNTTTVGAFQTYLSSLNDLQINILTSHPTVTNFATTSDVVIGGQGSLTSTTTSAFQDKSKFVWDDVVSKFKTLVGTSKADLDTGNLDAQELKVPSGSDILINNVELGNYSSFETEFLANL